MLCCWLIYPQTNRCSFILTEVGDATLAGFIHQDVFALQVPVSDGRFALSTKDLHVQMRQAAGDGQRHPEAGRGVQRAELQVVVQRTHLVIMSDEPELSAGVTRRHIRRDKTCTRDK